MGTCNGVPSSWSGGSHIFITMSQSPCFQYNWDGSCLRSFVVLEHPIGDAPRLPGGPAALRPWAVAAARQSVVGVCGGDAYDVGTVEALEQVCKELLANSLSRFGHQQTLRLVCLDIQSLHDMCLPRLSSLLL